MNKYYTGFRACFVICAAVLPNHLQAQWTACGTGPVQCAPTGNVGIGTTNPGLKLEIANGAFPYNMYLSGTAPSLYLGGQSGVFPNGGAGQAFAGFMGFATYQGAYSMEPGDLIVSTQSWQGGNSNAIRFMTPVDDSGRYGHVMSILRSGNVGIGTIAPNYKLDVGPGISGTQTATSGLLGLIRNNSFADLSPYTQARIIVYGGAGVDVTNWGYLGYGSDAIMRIVYGHTGQNHQLQIGQSSAMDGTGTFTPSMTVDGTSGNVGIGTTYPAAKLDVAGNLKVEGAVIFPDGTMQRTAASSYQSSVCVSNASQNQAVCPPGCSPTQVSSGASCQTNVKSNSCTANSGFTSQGFPTYGVCCVCH